MLDPRSPILYGLGAAVLALGLLVLHQRDELADGRTALANERTAHANTKTENARVLLVLADKTRAAYDAILADAQRHQIAVADLDATYNRRIEDAKQQAAIRRVGRPDGGPARVYISATCPPAPAGAASRPDVPALPAAGRLEPARAELSPAAARTADALMEAVDTEAAQLEYLQRYAQACGAR